MKLTLTTPFAAIGLSLVTFCLLITSCTGKDVQSNRQHELSTLPETSGVVNPLFVVSEDLAGQAFDQYEKMGENQQKVTIGEEQSLDISVQGISTTEKLKLAVLFLTPLDHARTRGYAFGLVAKTKTPEDLKDVRNVVVNQAVQNGRSVTFKVKTIAFPKDPNVNEPAISFVLLGPNGDRISPTTAPSSFIPDEKDLITAVAWENDGQDLTFPLYSGSAPNVTNTMEKMTLVVIINEQDRNLTFSLKKP